MLFKTYKIYPNLTVVKQSIATGDMKAAGQQIVWALHLLSTSAHLLLTTTVLSCGLVACKEV